MADMLDIARTTLLINLLLEPGSRRLAQHTDYDADFPDSDDFARLVDLVANEADGLRWTDKSRVVLGELDDDTDEVTLQAIGEDADHIIAVLYREAPEHVSDDLRDLNIMNRARELAEGCDVAAVIVIPRYPF